MIFYMVIFSDLFASHLGIVVDVFVLGKPLCLYLSSLYHPFTDKGAYSDRKSVV